MQRSTEDKEEMEKVMRRVAEAVLKALPLMGHNERKRRGYRNVGETGSPIPSDLP